MHEQKPLKTYMYSRHNVNETKTPSTEILTEGCQKPACINSAIVKRISVSFRTKITEIVHNLKIRASQRTCWICATLTNTHLNGIAEICPSWSCHHGQESSASPYVQHNCLLTSLFYSAHCSTNTLVVFHILWKRKKNQQPFIRLWFYFLCRNLALFVCL